MWMEDPQSACSILHSLFLLLNLFTHYPGASAAAASVLLSPLLSFLLISLSLYELLSTILLFFPVKF